MLPTGAYSFFLLIAPFKTWFPLHWNTPWSSNIGLSMQIPTYLWCVFLNCVCVNEFKTVFCSFIFLPFLFILSIAPIRNTAKCKCLKYNFFKQFTKIVSEYDQEIPQLQTPDYPVAPWGRAAQPSRDTRKTNQAKQSALSSPSRWLQCQNGHKVTYNKTQNNYKLPQWE